MKSVLKIDSNKHKVYWIEQLHREGLNYEFEVLEACESREPLGDAERFWIATARYLGCRLTNLTDGGEGQYGWHPRLETRMKIGRANAGKIPSAETRRKIGEGSKGLIRSVETRERMSAWQRGRTLTPEHRANISRTRLAKFEALRAAGLPLSKTLRPETIPEPCFSSVTA